MNQLTETLAVEASAPPMNMPTAAAVAPPLAVINKPHAPPPAPMRSQAFKAAVVLVALGPEGAAKILADLGSKRIRRFARILNEMSRVPPTEVEAALAEFIRRMEETRAVVGGRDATRRFLSEVLENDQVEQIMTDLASARRSVWSALGDVEDKRIADWLRREHPQVAAIALSRLTSVKAARVLEKLEEDEARDIVIRMGAAAAADPELTERIGAVIERDFIPAVREKQSRADPATMIASMMNHVSTEVRNRLVSEMEKERPTLAASVLKLMFTFENIVERVNARDVGLVVKEIEEATLLRALRSGGDMAEKVGEFIFGNIPKRLAERLREDLAAIEAPTRREGEAARAALVGAVVALRDRGEIRLIETETVED